MSNNLFGYSDASTDVAKALQNAIPIEDLLPLPDKLILKKKKRRLLLL